MIVIGYHDPERTGGGGAFVWSPRSEGVDDGGTVIRPEPHDPAAPGRWSRIEDGPTNVRWFGAVGDGKADDTAAIQRAIDATRSGGVLVFPQGRYRVTTLDTGRCETSWYFENAELVGGATQPASCILRMQGLHSRFFNMRIDAAFNDHYACALWWYNAEGPSQHNEFHGLDIRYARRGIVYGDLPGRTSTDFAQSENCVFGYHSRGVERPLYVNHGKGVLFLGIPQLVAHDEEWARDRPGAFDYRNNLAFEAIAGVLAIEGGEVQNSVAASASRCALVDGGEVYLDGCIVEVSAPFDVRGRLTIRGGRILNTQSMTSQFVVRGSNTAETVLRVTECRMFRNPRVGSFSDRPLLDMADGPGRVTIGFSGCEIAEWAMFSPLVTGDNRRVRFDRCLWHPDGSIPTRYHLDAATSDLLEGRGIDRAGRSIEGFYARDGAARARVVADPPTASHAGALSIAGPGVAGLFTMDATSPQTVQRTGISVRAGDRFLVEGWVRRASGRAAALSIMLVDSGGRAVPTGDDGYLVVCGSYQNFITDRWRYLRQVVVIPPGPAAYAGFGGHAVDGEVRFCALQVRRADAD